MSVTERRPIVGGLAPVASRDDHDQASVFLPESMLRETRRQRGLPAGTVPPVCILDPDGDIARSVQAGGGNRSAVWACYHSEMWEWNVDAAKIGVVGCAVGAPYAVLVAEQCFASGCQLLISITSAGQIASDLPDQRYILIDSAIRGDGTSHCYLPPAATVEADPALVARAAAALKTVNVEIRTGRTLTTDAPYRETQSSLDQARELGALAVEMEAAALYALSRARSFPIVCLAHVTNQMGLIDGDFEKGSTSGFGEAMTIIDAISQAVLPTLYPARGSDTSAPSGWALKSRVRNGAEAV